MELIEGLMEFGWVLMDWRMDGLVGCLRGVEATALEACENDTAAAAAAGCCVSARLSTETLRENMGQCKSEGQDFKRD
jgi:hypothetical protein